MKKIFIGSKLNLFLLVIGMTIFLGIFRLLIPVFIEEYCVNQAKKIVGNQWGKLYTAEGYEKLYAKQITWGFREQLKCGHKLMNHKN